MQTQYYVFSSLVDHRTSLRCRSITSKSSSDDTSVLFRLQYTFDCFPSSSGSAHLLRSGGARARNARARDEHRRARPPGSAVGAQSAGEGVADLSSRTKARPAARNRPARPAGGAGMKGAGRSTGPDDASVNEVNGSQRVPARAGAKRRAGTSRQARTVRATKERGGPCSKTGHGRAVFGISKRQRRFDESAGSKILRDPARACSCATASRGRSSRARAKLSRAHGASAVNGRGISRRCCW